MGKNERPPLPYLRVLRRIPEEYRSLLPLPFMLRQRCAVIGGENGKLTVAIHDVEQVLLAPTLKRLTGHTIFFVRVNERQLSRALEHMERAMVSGSKGRWPISVYQQLHARALLTLFFVTLDKK
ncbi:hypothetical protein KSX_12390 [Ktedonospora formicarum]|uniref:Type II secretion system protein GspE N-terminal domain-containing protein n=1 Tax=Ktedonospora formicarum TaxID=2778364 RepID=A0A8J3MQS7_9CHLR|nr:hypothetical protein KSX_12390 [Ktedonospora formicarum]